MRNERGLHGMQDVAVRHALDGEHIGAVAVQGQGQARIDPSTIEIHRAGAALTAIATLLGAGQMQTLAQKIEQRDTRVVELDLTSFTVNGQSEAVSHASVPVGAICYC
jgi:hypothetical protein